MRVRVHPHKTMVNAGVEACVSVTPVKKYGRAHYSGTVMLNNAHFIVHESEKNRAVREQVRNVHAWCVGDMVHEAMEQLPPSHPVLLKKLVQVTYHYNTGRFMTVSRNPHEIVDVTDGHFSVAYFCGRDFYVTKEW